MLYFQYFNYLLSFDILPYAMETRGGQVGGGTALQAGSIPGGVIGIFN